MLLGLRVVCSVLAVSLMLGGLVMSAAYLKTHSYPDFQCDNFSHKLNVSFNMTTGQFQLIPENQRFTIHSPISNQPVNPLNSTFLKALADKYGSTFIEVIRTQNMSS